jgi:hypothetical protein
MAIEAEVKHFMHSRCMVCGPQEAGGIPLAARAHVQPAANALSIKQGCASALCQSFFIERFEDLY